MKRELEIILDRRDNRSGRGNDPLSNFWEKIYRGVLLVDFAEKSKSKRIKSESRRQFIIILVTAFEVYVSDLIAELIEKKRINIEKLAVLPKDNYSLLEVANIIKNKITISEVVCSVINFQNLKVLNNLLTDIFKLKVDFLNYLKIHNFAYLNESNKRAVINFKPSFKEDVERIFDDRHNFIHDISFKNTPTYKYLDFARRLIIDFTFSIEILANKFRHNRNCEILEKQFSRDGSKEYR